MHFHVGVNVPGYMPDSDVATFETKRDAIAYLVDLKYDWLDRHAETLAGTGERDRIRFTGDARRDQGYQVEYLDRPHHLGYVLWLVDCVETDCEGEDSW